MNRNPYLDYAEAVARAPVFEPWENPSRRKKRKPVPEGALRTAPEAAGKLQVTIEQLFAFVRSGELRYVNMGHGKKRPRYRFDDSDIQELVNKRKQQDAPQCQFSKPRSPRRISGTISKSTVIGFTALRAARLEKKPKNTKR